MNNLVAITSIELIEGLKIFGIMAGSIFITVYMGSSIIKRLGLNFKKAKVKYLNK